MSYLIVNEDGSLSVLRTDPSEAEYAAVEEGLITLIRCRDGVFEQLVAESTTEEPDEQDEDELDVEPEPEVTWSVDWEAI